jgi:hypothetical protein
MKICSELSKGEKKRLPKISVTGKSLRVGGEKFSTTNFTNRSNKKQHKSCSGSKQNRHT